MNGYGIFCLELSILVLVAGAAAVRAVRDPYRARKWAGISSGLALIGATLVWQSHFGAHEALVPTRFSLVAAVFGRPLFEVDRLNAPLLVVSGLLSFLTFLSTQRTKLRRFPFESALISQALLMTTFGARSPWAVIAFLLLSVVPPFLELRALNRPTRLYALHMGVFVLLLLAGQSLVDFAGSPSGVNTGLALIAVGVLVRCGIVPFHCWLTEYFEHAPALGAPLLHAVPLTGVYAMFRLVYPDAPAGLLQFVAGAALVTAVYAGGMALVQREARRFFCFLLLSLSALVLAGLDSRTPTGLTGALCSWLSVSLSLGGLGLMLRALEARFGRLSLATYRGYYDQTPTIAICFALTALAAIGFPGTLGFVGTEMLIDGAVATQPVSAAAMIAATTLCGIAALRVYFVLFTGSRHVSDISLRIQIRERIAALALAALMIGGGLWSQPWIASRHLATEELHGVRSSALSAVPGHEPRSHSATAPVARELPAFRSLAGMRPDSTRE